jgi:hypothetical protein
MRSYFFARSTCTFCASGAFNRNTRGCARAGRQTAASAVNSKDNRFMVKRYKLLVCDAALVGGWRHFELFQKRLAKTALRGVAYHFGHFEGAVLTACQ